MTVNLSAMALDHVLMACSSLVNNAVSGERYDVGSLGQPLDVPFSSLHVDQPGAEQVSSVERGRDDANCSILVTVGVVFRSAVELW